MYGWARRVISVHIPEAPYAELKSLAVARGVPISKLVRAATTSFLEREGPPAGSVLELPPLDGGRELRAFRRDQLLEDMVRALEPRSRRRRAAGRRKS